MQRPEVKKAEQLLWWLINTSPRANLTSHGFNLTSHLYKLDLIKTLENYQIEKF